MGVVVDMGKQLLLRKVAKGMAEWFVANGTSAERLNQRLAAHEPVLEEALSSVTPEQIGTARMAAQPVLKSITHDDYRKLLAFLWEIPEVRAHAEVLGRYFQSDVVPALDKVKQWLATGSPS